MSRVYTLPLNLKGLFFLALVCCFCWGCLGKNIPFEVVQYVNQDIFNISQLEANALKSYASVTGGNYTTDERVYQALKETVVPYYKRLTELLRGISPENNELSRIHNLYIQGSEKMYNGFKVKMAGLEKKDDHLIRIANQQIEAGRDETLKWRDELVAFLQKSDVTMK